MNPDLIDIPSHKLRRFHYLSEGKFIGTLTIQSSVGKWSVLFRKGKIVWAIDCLYPHRFWKRQLLIHLPHFSLQQLAQIAAPLVGGQEIQPVSNWPYLGLVQLHQDDQIDSQKLGSILADSAQDVIFDILQASHTEELIYRTDSYQLPQPPPIIMTFEKLLIVPSRHWQEWQDSELTNIFPDYIPVIDRPRDLYQQTTTAIYENLLQIIDSYYSLREIAIHQQQDLFLLARSLLPHIQRQTISLHRLQQDLPQPLIETAAATPIEIAPTAAIAEPLAIDPPAPAITMPPPPMPISFAGLVAYIDDNGQANDYMADIVTGIGYQFIGIKDASEVLDRLQEQPPNLIIMESDMPLTSGRQICQQIRRSKQLAEIPVVLIVNQENIAERILAKLAGAASIITHPLDHDKVSEIVRHYVGNAPSP
jgi:two-component system, chemotaxis family, response regulator PixG